MLPCDELDTVEKLALATKELLQTIHIDGIDIKTLHKLASSYFIRIDKLQPIDKVRKWIGVPSHCWPFDIDQSWEAYYRRCACGEMHAQPEGYRPGVIAGDRESVPVVVD